jgi:cytochrome c553
MWQRLLLIMLISPVPAQAAQKAVESSCVRCHLAMGDQLAEPVKLSAQDIHFQHGLSCNNCHGGDPTKDALEEAMNPRKGFVAHPPRKQIAALCASCHSNAEFMKKYNPRARVDQYSEYLTSVHGKKNQAGDPNVATCTDCHGVHGIRAVSDPNSPVYVTNVAATCGRCHSDLKRMGSYGIPTDQQEQYSKSVHGDALMKQRDLSAPTCNSCHGNHGAAPPGVDSVANVCGQCHVTQWDLFNQSLHSRAFAENKWPACVTCHQNHLIVLPTDAMLGVEETATCAACHEKGSAGYMAAQQMKSEIAGLQNRLASAREVLERAQRAGMEVSSPIYQLSEGRDRLILARVQIHRFTPAILQKTTAEGESIATACEQSGWQALAELAYRRKGLAVSAAILLCMIGLLLLKIRQLKT